MEGFVESSPSRFFAVRLPHDGDLLEAIKGFAVRMGIEAGVLWVIGAVKRATVSFYNQAEKTYSKHSFDEPMEILVCLGNVAKLKGETLIHAHIVLGNGNGKAFGGHLEKGTIIFSAEMFLLELKGVTLNRKYDETTGLNLFNFNLQNANPFT
ncbi:TPA: DNA-binding protein [Candidatus Bathyarchaeota archaeon]|nr:DNA-binding protein [Candidatus Bathyarchaeota archaeon]